MNIEWLIHEQPLWFFENTKLKTIINDNRLTKTNMEEYVYIIYVHT